MDTINENTLINAINAQDSVFIDKALNQGFALKNLCIERALDITSKGLEFLHSKYKFNLSFPTSILSYMNEKQLDVCIKHGCKINEDLLLNFSLRTGLKEFKLLYKHNISIPETIVLQWTSEQYKPALIYYLQHGGNPNIRVFAIKDKYEADKKKIPQVIQLSHRSLIDEWYYQEGNSTIVKILQKYGGKLSPNAMTKQQEDVENDLFNSNIQDYLAIKNKQLTFVQNLYKSKQNIFNEEEKKEFILTINKLISDIKLANDLI